MTPETEQVLADHCHNGHRCPNGQLLWQTYIDAHLTEPTEEIRYLRRRWQEHQATCKPITEGRVGTCKGCGANYPTSSPFTSCARCGGRI